MTGGGCGRHSASSVKGVIAVSYDAHKYILEKIAGDDYDIRVLLPQGSDPETYEPDMRTMIGLENADAYFSTSTLGFERRMEKVLKENYPDLEIENMAYGIDLIRGTHRHHASHQHAGEAEGDDDETADPHLLSSLGNVRIISANMLSCLQNLNPGDSAKYRDNYERFQNELDEMQANFDSILRPLAGSAFVAVHPAMSYFARDYSLRQISLERDGKEASPRQMHERLKEAVASSPRVLMYEKDQNEKSARELARTLGIEAYPLTPESYGFLENLKGAAEAFASPGLKNDE